MNIETPIDYERSILAAIDAAEEIRDPLDELVEKTAGDPGAAFLAGSVGRACGIEERQPRRVRKCARTIEECRRASDGARRSHRRGERRRWRARTIAGRHSDQTRAIGRTVPHARTAWLTPTSTLTGIARPGKSAPRVFAAG